MLFLTPPRHISTLPFRTSTRAAAGSALPQRTDIVSLIPHVRRVPSADFELLRSSAFQLARYPPAAQRSARSLRLAWPRAQLYRAEPYYRPEKCCSAWSLNDPLIADGSIDLVNRLTITNRSVG
jgi:hypothetical protein